VLPNLSAECSNANNLVKIYPENNVEAELDILWCDFVQGKPIASEQPAAKVKCVVWDLDNTIWDGTLIETEDPDTLALKPGVLDVIQELDNRGIVQSIASKNDHAATMPVVDKLGIAEYFLYPQIHWNSKSGSVEQIARSLNIGIDSLALIDDTAFERNQVASVWPQVRTYDIAEVSGLLGLPEFDVPITAEGKARRKMYQAEEKRNTLMQSEQTDIADFIRKCNLRMHLFDPQTEDEKFRCYELIVRTNQLNMAGKKYTADEFAEVLARPEHKNFAFSCSDDFGEYGIVGFGQYRVEGEMLVFTEFAMSCRVAGKFVESALFSHLLKTENCTTGKFEVVKTKKNILLRNTLEQLGFISLRETGSSIMYIFTDNLLNWNIVDMGLI
jgi:FkbH-like protein